MARRFATRPYPEKRGDLIFKIRSYSARSDLKNKQKTAENTLILRSDLTVQDRILKIGSLASLGKGPNLEKIQSIYCLYASQRFFPCGGLMPNEELMGADGNSHLCLLCTPHMRAWAEIDHVVCWPSDEKFNLAWNLQSRLKISILLEKFQSRPSELSTKKIRGWWVARLKISISLENFKILNVFKISALKGVRATRASLGNARLFTKLEFVFLCPLIPPPLPTSKVLDFPLNLY